MVERNDAAPPRGLLELARTSIDGEVSPRRHLASRARLLSAYEQKPRSPRWLPFVVGGTVALGGVAFEGTQIARHHLAADAVSISKSAAPSEEPVPPVSDEVEPAVAPAEEEHETPPPGITIHVEPDSATVTWDDKPVEDNQVQGPPDGKVHRVTAKAPGYVTSTQIVTASSPSITVSFELSPVPLEVGPVVASVPLADANDAIESLRPRVRECYAAGQTDGAANGKTTIVLELDAAGGVRAVDLKDKEGLSVKATACLAHVASDTHFDTGGKAATIRIPIRFGAH